MPSKIRHLSSGNSMKSLVDAVMLFCCSWLDTMLLDGHFYISRISANLNRFQGGFSEMEFLMCKKQYFPFLFVSKQTLIV